MMHQPWLLWDMTQCTHHPTLLLLSPARCQASSGCKDYVREDLRQRSCPDAMRSSLASLPWASPACRGPGGMPPSDMWMRLLYQLRRNDLSPGDAQLL